MITEVTINGSNTSPVRYGPWALLGLVDCTVVLLAVVDEVDVITEV